MKQCCLQPFNFKIVIGLKFVIDLHGWKSICCLKLFPFFKKIGKLTNRNLFPNFIPFRKKLSTTMKLASQSVSVWFGSCLFIYYLLILSSKISVVHSGVVTNKLNFFLLEDSNCFQDDFSRFAQKHTYWILADTHVFSTLFDTQTHTQRQLINNYLVVVIIYIYW